MKLTLLLSVTLLLNLPSGYYRENFKRMSWQWLLILHAPIPFIIMTRLLLGFELMDYVIIPVILVAIIAQLLGAKTLRRYFPNKEQQSKD